MTDAQQAWDNVALEDLDQPIVVWSDLLSIEPSERYSQECNVRRYCLPKHVDEDLNNYHFASHASLALYSYLLQRIVPAKISGRLSSWKQVQLTTCGENGKPCLGGNGLIEFNVSHHSNTVAIALRRDGIVIGIDIISSIIPENWLNNNNSWLDDFAQYALSSNEVAIIKNATTSCQQESLLFFSIWSLKESYLKAIGTGITDNLKDIEFDIPWQPPPQPPTHRFPHLLFSNAVLSINSVPQLNWSFYTYLLNSHIICSIASPNVNTKPPKFISLSPTFILDITTNQSV